MKQHKGHITRQELLTDPDWAPESAKYMFPLLGLAYMRVTG